MTTIHTGKFAEMFLMLGREIDLAIEAATVTASKEEENAEELWRLKLRLDQLESRQSIQMHKAALEVGEGGPVVVSTSWRPSATMGSSPAPEAVDKKASES